MEFEITYFPAKGRAEFLRLVLAAAGQEFKDTRIGGEDWLAFKPKTPMGSMPVLTLRGGEKDIMLCQTNAIATYLGKKFGLCGTNPLEDALINEVLDSMSDTQTSLTKWFVEKDEDKKAEHLKVFEAEAVPKFINYLKLRREQVKGNRNGYIVGSKLSIADIGVFAFCEFMKDLGITALANYPDIQEHSNLVKSNTGIAKWQAEHDDGKK